MTNDKIQMTNEIKKPVICALIFVSFLMFAAGCGRKTPPDLAKKKAQKDVQQDGVAHKILSFNLEGLTEKGEKKWEVVGRTARSISENEIRLGSVAARSYNNGESVITADEGVYDKSKNNVRLEKNVKATIETAANAEQDQMGFPIGSFDTPKNAPAKEGTDEGAQKKKTVITCDGEAEFDYGKSLVYFKDNVKVRSDDGNIDADKITVNLDSVSKKITDIVAEGHVKITQKENAAYCDKAKHSEATKTVSLSGNPKVVMSQEASGGITEQFAGK